MKKTVNYPPVGEIEVRTNRNCNGIRYSVYESCVKITVAPAFYKSVFPIPKEKIQWILQSKEKLQKNIGQKFSYNADTQIDTFSFRINFAPEPKLENKFSARLQDMVLTIKFPPQLDFQTPKNQTVIKNIVKHFLTVEAKRILPPKLEKLAKMHNFSFSEIKISSAKRRWGSCNGKKSISLSCYLLFLHENLIDMVLVHELCHTEQMNHGVKFYARLRQIFPNLTELEKERKIIEKRIAGMY
ncbi:MAG: M48 family metallopeptidase [Prevotellaceae bacterium]|jgi:predicted metal-dependent hydrolase|nr:M48 family metallopeptidase [Prevotellaceae bacterium]